jgi:hypothetical protein
VPVSQARAARRMDALTREWPPATRPAAVS